MKYRRSYYRQLFENAGSTDQTNSTQQSADQKSADQNTSTNTDKDTKKYSDADLDKIIGDKFAKWQKQQEKSVDEAKKLANMNAEQKAEHQISELQKQLAELQAANTKASLQTEARKILSEQKLNLSDELVASLVGKDAESTKTNINSFVKTFNAAVDAEVKNRLKGKAPAGGGDGSSSVTKESIMKIQNRAERQKLISEHMDLFTGSKKG